MLGRSSLIQDWARTKDLLCKVGNIKNLPNVDIFLFL